VPSVGGNLPRNPKRLSALRRVPTAADWSVVPAPGAEGDVCAFELVADADGIGVEATSGRPMTIVAGDVFLATPGHLESTRWVVGGVPEGGLVPGAEYWVLAECGVVGDLAGHSPVEKRYLGRVTFLGAIRDTAGKAVNIGQFAAEPAGADRGAPVFIVVGTSAEVGKTTAGVAVLRALRRQGVTEIVALKATGTPSVTELSTYLDLGASRAFDCVDFGVPTTYPSDRADIGRVFEAALDTALSAPADAVVVECGGDILGANVPEFLERLKRRRDSPRVVLAAADTLAALGAQTVLREMGMEITLITGPCTDTPTSRQRTEAMCGVPARNLAKGGGQPSLS
jgi:hypothetical protein